MDTSLEKISLENGLINLYCVVQWVDCYIFERNINSSKVALNLSQFECTYWAKIHFDIICAYSVKMKLKSGHLELAFSVLALSLYISNMNERD